MWSTPLTNTASPALLRSPTTSSSIPLGALEGQEEHPKQFVYHMGHDLVVNGIDIYKQINESVAYYSTQDWKKMGESIGEALDLIIVGTGKKHAPQPEMYV